MTTIHTSFLPTPYIAAGTQKVHLEAFFNDLKLNGEVSWKKFNSFEDVDDFHIGKLLHLLQNKTAAAEQEQRASTNHKIVSIVALIFAGLVALACLTIGILAFVATFPLSIALATVAVAVGSVGLSIIIPCSVILSRKKAQNFQPSHFSNLLKKRPIWKDPAFTNLCKLADTYLFNKNQKIAASEYLAHEMAYEDLKEGQIIPIQEEVGKITYARVRKSINKEGFVCFILTPLQEKHYLKSFPVWELFRGTHDIKSVRRLGEAFSAGHSSYKLYEKELLDAKAAIVPKTAEAVVEKKCGHSLGGADAQRSVTTTAVKIAEVVSSNNSTILAPGTFPLPLLKGRVTNVQSNSDYLSRVRRIEVYTWNSTGIGEETNDKLKEAVAKINQAKQNGKTLGCEIAISTGKVRGDAIQRFGRITLGHGIPVNTPNVNREVFKFQHGFEGVSGFFNHWGKSTIHAHRIKNLNRRTNGGKDPSYTHYTCKTNYAEVEYENSDHITIGGTAWETAKSFISAKLIGRSHGL